MLFPNINIQDELSTIARDMGDYATQHSAELRSANDPAFFSKEMVNALDPWLYERLHTLNSDIGYCGKSLTEGDQEVRWITSLWSGTNSFFRDGYQWSVHLGLQTNNGYRLAYMYLPVLNELFYAETGKGATKNGKSVFPGTDTPLSQCTGGVGFSCVREGLEDNCIPIFNKLLPEVAFMNILPIGSASCKVADRTFDFMFEKELSLNQIYSASVILEEAGGCVTDFQGNKTIDPSNILFSSNQRLLDSLLPYMAQS